MTFTDSNTARQHSTTHADQRTAVRWYVLVLPPGHQGSRTKRLDAEIDRRTRCGEPVFEYFAPTIVERRAERPLYFNYVFVHASELDILQIKQRVPIFNFMRRVADSQGGHYPYVSNETMANLQRVAAAYAGCLPAYRPDPSMLRRGDRVRIRGGRFDGVEATLVRRPASAAARLTVRIDNWLWVPLMDVEPGNYEILELCADSNALHALTDNDATVGALRSAMLAWLLPGGPTDAQRRLAAETAMRYGRPHPASRVQRAKHLAMMIQAFAVADDSVRLRDALDEAARMLHDGCPDQSRALLLAAIYAATGRRRDEALAAVAPWRNDPNPKKNKRELIAWLDAIDNIHRPNVAIHL